MLLLYKSKLKYMKYNKINIKYYHNIKRGNFSILNNKNINYFNELLGKKYVVINKEELIQYNIDWTKKYKGIII